MFKDHSTGPVSTRPGHTISLPVGAGVNCDDCDNKGTPTAATVRVQGETDSMGCEYSFYCTPCHNKREEEESRPVVGTCEWCKKGERHLHQERDLDGEGSYGPLYWICMDCHWDMHDRLEEECREYDRQAGKLLECDHCLEETYSKLTRTLRKDDLEEGWFDWQYVCPSCYDHLVVQVKTHVKN